MTKCGIDIRRQEPEAEGLLQNFRRRIRRWAVGVLHGVTVDDLDDATDDLKGYRSLFHGPAPEIVFEKTSKAEIMALAESDHSRKDERIEESDICVLARTKTRGTKSKTR